MPTPIRVIVGDRELLGELDDGETAGRIAELLPLEGEIQRFGGELSIEIPLERTPEAEATHRVRIGDLAYWPPGRCLSVFAGPTPLTPGVSEGAPETDVHVIASSAVTLVGRLECAEELVEERSARRLRVERR